MNYNTTFIQDHLSVPQPKSEITHTTEKPSQYQIGMDTFERMEINSSKEEILGFCKGNIDKYLWRKKEQDLEDFNKIIAYANFAIRQLSKP